MLLKTIAYRIPRFTGRLTSSIRSLDPLRHHPIPHSSYPSSRLLKPRTPNPPSSARSMSVLAGSKRLRGKTILITGASSGIGKSCAMQFAMMSPGDLKLILTARRIDVLKQVAEEINKEVGQGVKILPVQLDVADAEAIRTFARDLREKEEWKMWREVDVLVNNVRYWRASGTGMMGKERLIPVFCYRPVSSTASTKRPISKKQTSNPCSTSTSTA